MLFSALFQKPKIPQMPTITPPRPVRNTQVEAEIAESGRRQGLISSMFGYRNPSGGSSGHQLTGQ